MMEQGNAALNLQNSKLNEKELIEELLCLYGEERREKLKELNDEQLRSLAPTLVKMAKAQGNIVSQMLEKESFIKNALPGNLQSEIMRQLSAFKVKRQKMALYMKDNEFGSLHEKMDATIEDLNQKRVPIGMLHELLYQNIFKKEEVIDNETGEVTETTVESRTFLGYALAKFIPIESEFILQDLQENLGYEQFKFYTQILNCLGSGKRVSAREIFFGNHGIENQQERDDIAKADYYNWSRVIELISPEDTEQGVVNIHDIDTHNTSSHKTADESHVAAFRMMIDKQKQLGVIASYEDPIKAGDPPRKINIINRGNLDSFIEKQIESLKEELDKLVLMSDSELYDEYLMYNDVEYFSEIKYGSLEDNERSEFALKINAFRFQAQAAKRYIDGIVTNHKCDSGTFYYDTNTADICGLTMEEMLATAYFSSHDKDNFKNSNVTEKNAFFSLVKQLYDIKRGYYIDSGIDDPDNFKFPEEPGNDNNRCLGGAVNSLPWGLASIHNAYTPKNIERRDIERALSKQYEEIINDQLDYIKKNIDSNQLIAWSSSNKVTGPLKNYLQNIFYEEFLDNFSNDYYGYVPDNIFNMIIEQGLDNVKIPKSLKSEYSIEYLSINEIHQMIANNRLPLLHLDLKNSNYDSTLNYLSKLDGKETLIKDLMDLTKEYHVRTQCRTLSFLSKSNLDEKYKQEVVFTLNVMGKCAEVTLNDLSILNEIELYTLFEAQNHNKILEISIEKPYYNLLALYCSKVDLTYGEIWRKHGAFENMPLHIAATAGYVYAIKRILSVLSDKQKVNSLTAPNINYVTPIRIASEKNFDILNEILSSLGKNQKVEALSECDRNRNTILHTAALRGRVNVIETIYSHLDEDQKIKLLKMENASGYGAIHISKYSDVKTLRALLSGFNIDQRVEFLCTTDKELKQTKFHNIAISGFTDIIEESFSGFSPSQKVNALKAQDNSEDTPLHILARKSVIEMDIDRYKAAIKTFLSGLSTDQKMELLSMQNKSGNTPLYITTSHITPHIGVFEDGGITQFAIQGSIKLIKEVLLIEGINKVDLLRIENKNGKKVLDLLKPSYLENVFDITFSNELGNHSKVRDRRKNSVLEEVYKYLKSGNITNIDATSTSTSHERIIIEKERDRIIEQILERTIVLAICVNSRSEV